MVKSSSGKANLRSFTIVNVSKHNGCKTKFRGGRYLSRNPASAAKKAFNEHCRVKRIRGVCTLHVTVEETTQGSKHKRFTYKLNRRKLQEPIVRFEGSPNEYKIQYMVHAKAAANPSNCKRQTPVQTRGRMAKLTRRANIRKAQVNSRKRSRVSA